MNDDLSKPTSLIYKDGFRYGVLCFLIFVSIRSGMACNQYVVSYSSYITIVLACLGVMLYYGLLMMYKRVWFEIVGVCYSTAYSVLRYLRITVTTRA